MPRDPWKRAYDRQRLSRAGHTGVGRRQPRAPRRSYAGAVTLILLLFVLAGSAYAAWHYRDRWLPRVHQELPPAIAEHVPLPKVELDYAALEQGLGRGLVLLGDFLVLIEGTRELEPEWDVLQTGATTLRLASDGILVYVKDGLIQTYTIELPEFFASPKWERWRGEWRAAGISPDLSWQMFTGAEQPPAAETEQLYVSPEAVKLPEGWVHRAFNFEFQGGVLRRLEGRLEFGPSAPEQQGQRAPAAAGE